MLLKRKAEKMRKMTGDERYYAPLDLRKVSMVKAVLMSCYTPFSEYCYSCQREFQLIRLVTYRVTDLGPNGTASRHLDSAHFSHSLPRI